MQSIVRVDSDQMRIEGGMVDLRQEDAVGDQGLPQADSVNFDDFLAWRAKIGNLLAVVWFEK